MNVSVRDSRRSRGDRDWLESVYGGYLNDLAPLGTGLFPVLDEIGHRGGDQLARSFADSSTRIFTVLYGDQPVGFAMVRLCKPGLGQPLPNQQARDFSMAEFFIDSRWRRRGIGQQAVRLILDRFAGRWEIMEYQRNPGAVKFWRDVVSQYTDGRYQERVSNGEVYQYFQSGARR
ncbi:MAG: GNAT family N-acetyltransferase [Steroidobacteraceae bacterium]